MIDTNIPINSTDNSSTSFLKKIDFELLFRSLIAFFVIVLLVIAYNFKNKIDELDNLSNAIIYIADANAQMQRLVRMELTGELNDQLIGDIDTLFAKLQSIDHELIESGNNNSFRTLIVSWENLKIEIYNARTRGWKTTRILYTSETAYYATHRLTTELMHYFTHLPSLLSVFQLSILFTTFLLLVGVGVRVYHYIKTIHIKEEEVEASYIDKLTNLYSRSKCQALLNSTHIHSSMAVLVIYDLNNLKIINDTFGHQGGDTLIAEFANALIKTRDESHLKPFIGRYGGDEFILYFEDATTSEITKYAETLDLHVQAYNATNNDFSISFARGRAFAHELASLGLVSDLFDIADARMYQDKLAGKRSTNKSTKDNVVDRRA